MRRRLAKAQERNFGFWLKTYVVAVCQSMKAEAGGGLINLPICSCWRRVFQTSPTISLHHEAGMC